MVDDGVDRIPPRPAAADVAAGEVDPEVQSLTAFEQAVLAAVDGRRKLA